IKDRILLPADSPVGRDVDGGAAAGDLQRTAQHHNMDESLDRVRVLSTGRIRAKVKAPAATRIPVGLARNVLRDARQAAIPANANRLAEASTPLPWITATVRRWVTRTVTRTSRYAVTPTRRSAKSSCRPNLSR